MSERRPAQLAYDPEAQAIVVRRLQENDLLRQKIMTVKEIAHEEEQKVTWTRVAFQEQAAVFKVLSTDCNPAIDSVQPEDNLLLIYGVDRRRDVAQGRDDFLVAAILKESQPVYVSPLFDLPTYRRRFLQ